MLAAVLMPVTRATAQTATNYVVEVGAMLPGTPGESMRFLPSGLDVHDGDTITFVGGFHTATLLPSDTGVVEPARTDADEWIRQNARGVAKPWSLLDLDEDEGTGALKGNNAAVLPPTICGTPTAPCLFDGDTVVNSGLLFFGEGFTVEIDGSAGDVFTVICLAHLHMRMKIRVVDAETPTPTQTEIDSAKEALVAEDTELATALHNRLITKKSKHTTPNGTVVWDAWAGYDAHHVTLFAMYPRTLKIRKGQRVRWHFNQLVSEDHTVTFPLGQGLQIANQLFVPVCDPDGDTGTEPDTQPTSEAPPFCDDPSQLEFDIPSQFALPSGNGRVTSKSDFENSAVRGANVTSDDPYTLRFTKPSGRTPYKYVCLVHPFMRGRVKVRS